MQVGDYIIQQRYKNDPNYMYIFKVLRICIDGYLEVEPQAIYDAIDKKQYNPIAGYKVPKHITTARVKLYHPTLEELFIFKSFKEQS